MRPIGVLAAFAAMLLPAPAVAAADPARYMPTDLIAATVAPKPGSTILVGFRMAPRPGWHGYWSNPGDAGVAPTVKWSARPGVRFGALLHPAPTLISADGINSFVHDGPHILIARMTLPRSLAAGAPIPVKAELRWAACTATQCVPLHATFTLDLIAGNGARSPEAGQLAAAQSQVPKPAPAGIFTSDGKRIALKLPTALRIDPDHARFFPDSNDAFDTARASAVRADGTVILSAPAGNAMAESISGVVTDGARSYRLSFARRQSAANASRETAEQRAPASRLIALPPAAETPRASNLRPHSSSGPSPWIAVAAALAAIAALALWRQRRG